MTRSRLSPRRPWLSRLSPPQLIALSFAFTILLGAALLWLPLAHEPGKTLTFVQALFMATSCVCVTGLAVVDPGSTFNIFGELVMVLLIQVGGLGLITLGTLFALALRRRVGVQDRIHAAQQRRVARARHRPELTLDRTDRDGAALFRVRAARGGG